MTSTRRATMHTPHRGIPRHSPVEGRVGGGRVASPRVTAVALVALGLCAATALPPAMLAPAAAAEPAPHPAQGTVDRWSARPELEGASLGVSVVCADDGAEWAALGADRLMNPASGAKILTSVAALDRLPHDTRWGTEARGELGPDGRTRGDLTLVARGDPSLQPGHLAELADALVEAGLASIAGDLVIDTSLFAPPDLPPAYDQKDADAAYRPTVPAANLAWGAVTVTVRPGRRAGEPARVSLRPAAASVTLIARAETAEAGSPEALVVVAEGAAEGATRLTVTGTIPAGAKAAVVRRRLEDPAVVVGQVFAELLRERGVALVGGVRLERSPTSPAERPPVLAQHPGTSLADSLLGLNTWSNNAIAEAVFKHLGRGDDGEPATWERAQAAVAAALEARGVPPDQVRVVNGSGLYDATRITPRAMARLLAGLAGDDPTARAFRGSLAVAGETGTLRWRLRREDVRGRVLAKTGTLDGVATLAGYLPTRSGCTLAFVALINDADGAPAPRLRRALDRLILDLARL